MELSRNDTGSPTQEDGSEHEELLEETHCQNLEAVKRGQGAARKAIINAFLLAGVQGNTLTPPHMKRGPLTVPGRLRFQHPSAPTALRFVPTPRGSQFKQALSNRWQKPLQIKPISKDLKHVDWAEWAKRESAC